MCEAPTVSEPPEPAAFVPPDRPASDAGGASAATSARLWFIPLVVVFAVALVWLLSRWSGSRSVSPQEIVRDLGRPGKSHWQQAYVLAELLHSSQHAGLKQDAALAAQLSALLEAQLDDVGLDANRLNMRIFLCRALGEFAVPAVQPVLLRASRLERNPAEIAVRRAAVEAIAAHAVGVGPSTLHNNAALAQTLIATALEGGRDAADKTQREELRASVAFALGVLGSEPALDELQRLLDDPSANVRYNAATGLARHGHTAALPVLLEMLDPGNPQAVAGEVSAAGRTWKREAVLNNAIRAAQQWAQQNPQADHEPLIAAVEALVTADLTVSVRTLARQTLPALSVSPKQ
jgi:hypothetical protein